MCVMKRFKCKIMGNRYFLQESVRKYTSGDMVRLRVVIGLDNSLSLVDPLIFDGKNLLNINEIMEMKGASFKEVMSEVRTKNWTLFYPIESLTYVCEHVLEYKGDEVTKNTVNLYIPVDVDGRDLICEDISMSFSRYSINSLANSMIDYTLSSA